jgi:radical SAM superfamily enzyme
VSKLPLYSIKFHQLQIVRETAFEKQYISDPKQFKLFSFEEYVDFIIEYLGRLNPNFIIERLAAETQPENCVSDRWGIRYDQVLRTIEQKMEELDTWQGKFRKNE